MNYRKNLQHLILAGIAGALALYAGNDFWKTKEYTQWTSEETSKLLSDSPWAKGKKVTTQGAGGQQRRGGGMGRSRGGMGGGYPGGGGGYPGGGGGYPGGGGASRGQGEQMDVVVRWHSALPVQYALLRQGGQGASEDAKQSADAIAKDYIITVTGLHLPSRRSQYGNSSDTDQDANATRERLLDAAQLQVKGRDPMYPEDVQVDPLEVRFLFLRKRPISPEDKEVTFHLQTGQIKFDLKFHLGDMMYQGKLAL